MIGASESVWITGVGASTPLGFDLATIDESLLAGRSGVTTVTRFPTEDFPSRIAGQIDTVPCPAGRDPQGFAALSRVEQLGVWCIESALKDAGWWGRHDGPRVGLVLGLGAEWLLAWEADFLAGGTRIYEPERDRESTLDRIRQTAGIRGPALGLSAACASGTHAIEIGRQWLRMGLVDACVAGACDMGVTPIGLGTFCNLRAISRRNDAPQAASRPFDRGRDGFILGEGGAVFVLEREPDARRRSARAYAEVAGCGASSDAYHPVIPSPDPAPAGAAIRQALADAGINPDQVDHINAHATSTPVGDAAEAKAIHATFGDAVDRVPVSSTKSMTGHLMTAAGAFEVIACLTAMTHQAIPPTINLDEPDVDLRLVAHEAVEHPVRITMSNSFGFGGSNTCLVLRSV